MQEKKYICPSVMLSVIGLSIWGVVEMVRLISGDPESDWENSGCIKAGGYHKDHRNLFYCSSEEDSNSWQASEWSCTLFSNVTVNNNGTILDCQQECVDDCDAYSLNSVYSYVAMLLGGLAIVSLYKLPQVISGSSEPTDDQVGLIQTSVDEEMQQTTADSETDYRFMSDNSLEISRSI
ncbi:MAG: hypothetical protein ACE365_06595 [Gammaproteobacteria bacterium]